MPVYSKIFGKRHFFTLMNSAYSTKLDKAAQTEALIVKDCEACYVNRTFSQVRSMTFFLEQMALNEKPSVPIVPT